MMMEWHIGSLGYSDHTLKKLEESFKHEKHLLPVAAKDFRRSLITGLAVVGVSGSTPIAFTRLTRLVADESIGDWFELGSTWIHSDYRGRNLCLSMYKIFLPLHKDKNILATTTSRAVFKVGKRLGFVGVPRSLLPESLWKASCICPSHKTGVKDNGQCRLAWQEPQLDDGRFPCLFRVTPETAKRLNIVPNHFFSLTHNGVKVK